MLYQIQSTLTVLIDACLLLVPVLFVAHVVCKFGPKKAEDQGSIAEVEVAEDHGPIAEVEVAEDQTSIAEVEVAEDQTSIAEVEVAEVKEVEPEVEVAEVKEVEPEVEVAEDQTSIAEVEVAEVKEVEPEVEVAEDQTSIAEVEVAEVKEVEPEVEVAEDQTSIAEVEVAEVNPEPESLFLALEKDQAMKCETLMDMLDRVSEEIESSIHAWDLGTDMITTPLEVKEARLRFKAGEDLVVSTECDRTRECFKVQKIGNKYVYALNFEGTTCKFSIESVKFWIA